MKTFKYTARTTNGPASEGVIEANTQAEAVSLLRGDGLIVEHIEVVAGEHDIDLRIGTQKTKDKTLAVMCNQFAIILTAGLPIVRSIQLIASQTEDKTLKVILQNVSDEVAAGYSLADSFQKHGPGLPATFVESVRAGEQSGNLDVVFRRLSDFYEKQDKARGKLKSALIYPSFVVVVAVVVVAIIMVVAVPMFKSTFESLGGELPIPTKILIWTSDFMTNYFLVILGVFVAVFLGIKIGTKRNEDFRLRWAKMITQLPVIGKISQMTAASQYASTMSVMMEAGLPVVRAVEVTSATLSNYYMSQALASCGPDLEAGRTLTASLAKSEAFPQLAVEMTGVGEETGSLEHTLQVIADYYDNEVDTATTNAVNMIEPVMIVFLAVLVMIILLAVYLPMFTMYDSI